MDMFLEILMGAVLLAVVLRACWQGNPRPSVFVAIGGAVIAVVAAIRHLEMSDIILPLMVAVIAGIIGGLARGRGAKPQLK
jgi:hypothetical protein